MRHPELAALLVAEVRGLQGMVLIYQRSGSFQITHYTIIENNYGQLKQMDAHRCSIKFL